MIEMTKEEYEDLRDMSEGVCLACGEPTCNMVEPDAENYLCECCGESEVFGVDQAMLLGEIEIIEKSEEEDWEL